MGHKYPSAKITTTYSCGLSCETNSPKDFPEFVMDLRGSGAGPYAERDASILNLHRSEPARHPELPELVE
ncbi:MAG: hypothetical protein QF579_00590 [Dehalococcoidia bacterium]|nr:hypothetical protein [Dehalococcoidia bacterium]